MDRRELLQCLPLLGMKTRRADQQLKELNPSQPERSAMPIILAPCNGDSIPENSNKYVDVYGHNDNCTGTIYVVARSANGYEISNFERATVDDKGYWHARIRLNVVINPFSIFAFCGGLSAIASGLNYGDEGPVIDPYIGYVKHGEEMIFPYMEKEGGKHYINLRFKPKLDGEAEVTGWYWSSKKMKFKKMQMGPVSADGKRKFTIEDDITPDDLIFLKFTTNNIKDDKESKKNSFLLDAHALHAVRRAR